MAQTKVKLIANGVIVQGNLHASHGITTADIGENASYLYYTDARVSNYLSTNGYDTATNIIASITDSAPSTLDTLNELAAALGDDANFSTTVTNSIALKAPLASPSFTGNATFAGTGTFTSATSYVLTAKSTDTDAADIFRVIADDDGAVFTVSKDASDNAEAYLYSGAGAANIELYGGTGNATFAGAVTAPSVLANSFMEIRSDAASLYFENAANNNYYRLKRSSNDFVIDYYNGTTTSDRLTINSSGNIGIGTSSPDRQLEIYGVNDGYIKFDGGRAGNHGFTIGSELSGFVIYDDTLSTYRFVIDQDSGNVGIGTTSPAEILQTNKNSAGNIVGGYFTNSQANTGAESVSLAFGLNRSGGDFVRQVKAITFGAEQQWTGTPSTVDGYLAFSTVSDETISERMRITSAGNVGIGITSPSKKLDVAGDFKLDGISGGHFENYAYGTQLNISELTAGGWARANRIVTSDSGGDVFYGVFGSNTTLTYAYWNIGDGSNNTTNYANSNGVILTKAGNVGIGTTSPAQKLDVNGNIAIRDTYKIFFNHNTNTARYIGASSTNDLDIAADDDINYRSNYQRFWNGSTEFARLSGSTNSWIANGSNGKLGIGTTSPVYKLDVNGTTRATSSYHQNVNFTNTPAFQIGTDAFSSGFFVYDSTAAQYRMVVKSSTGNVGIGTTSPGYTFTVNKSIANDWLALFGNTYNGAGNGVLIDAGDGSSGEILRLRDKDGNNRVRFLSNGEVSSHNHQAGSHGFVLNSLSRVSDTGYVAGNSTLSFTYDCYDQGSLFIQCVFNHYGYIATYGCSRVATFANGPNLQIQDIQNITSSFGGSWTITRVSNTRFTVAKTAGSYGGAGYYMINITGTGLKYT